MKNKETNCSEEKRMMPGSEFIRLREQIWVLMSDAKKNLITALKDACEEDDLKIGIKDGTRSGVGTDTIYNDRRDYYWIDVTAEERNYRICLFESEIDPMSGNCHCQLGKVRFVKGLIKNRSNCLSPNEIMDNDRNNPIIIFHSFKWVDPLPFCKGVDKSRLANGKWITIDDLLREKDNLSKAVADAFVRFLKDDLEK